MSVCATCHQPGLPADGQHDCPGLGDIQLSRQLGRGVRVDTAPPRARMTLTVLADHGYGLSMQGADLINIADQVLYQVVGYDAESAALVLELVEDWRPKHTPDDTDPSEAPPEPRQAGTEPADETALATLVRQTLGMTIGTGKDDHATALHAACRELNNSEASRAYLGLREQLRRSVEERTTLRRAMNPDDVRLVDEMTATVEQQRTRADNAEGRLRLAREALIRDGYFTAAEVGPDIAPRIVEWLSHHRGLIETLNAEVARLTAGEEPGWDPMTVPTPGQWIAYFNRADAAGRLDVAKRVIDYTTTAGTCFEMNHVRRLEEDRQAQVAMARVRDVIAEMEKYVGTRHYALLLHAALGGQVPESGAVAGQPLTETQAAAVRGADLPRGTRISREAVDEAVRQADADPHGLKAGLVVKPYTERGVQKWVFRCWGTDACDGWLSLDHAGENSAAAARDRHLVEAHPEMVGAALRERRERAALLGAVLGEALSAFRSVVDDGTRTLVGYVSAPVHPDDMDRWRAALEPQGAAVSGYPTPEMRKKMQDVKPGTPPSGPAGASSANGKRILIDPPDASTILAARHLDATEGPVQVGATVDTATRSAITTVLRYIDKAYNSPAADRVRALHVRNPHSGTCEHCSAGDYPDYAVPWPCPTVTVLDEPKEPTP